MSGVRTLAVQANSHLRGISLQGRPFQSALRAVDEMDPATIMAITG